MDPVKIKKVETAEELTDAQEVRRKVFQEEQGISFNLDVDGEDLKSDHLIAYIENKPVATLRIRYIDNKAKIERMAVLLELRGRGIGKQIMEFAFSYLVEEKIIREIVLNAQMRAKNLVDKRDRIQAHPHEEWAIAGEAYGRNSNGEVYFSTRDFTNSGKSRKITLTPRKDLEILRSYLKEISMYFIDLLS